MKMSIQREHLGLFKPEFIGSKMIALTPKCYFAEGKKGKKYSCKGMSKSQNDLNWRQIYERATGLS